MCYNGRSDAPTRSPTHSPPTRSPTTRPSRNPSFSRAPTVTSTIDVAAISEESHRKKAGNQGKIIVAVVIVGLVLLFASLFLGIAMRRIYGKPQQTTEEENDTYKPQQNEEKKQINSMKSGIFSTLSFPIPETREETVHEDDDDEESSGSRGRRHTTANNTSRSHVSYCSSPPTPSMTLDYSNYPSSSLYSKHSPSSTLKPTIAAYSNSQRALPLPPRDFGNDHNEYGGVGVNDDDFYSAQPPSWDEEESQGDCRRVVNP
jgi:hypothetical protein